MSKGGGPRRDLELLKKLKNADYGSFRPSSLLENGAGSALLEKVRNVTRRGAFIWYGCSSLQNCIQTPTMLINSLRSSVYESNFCASSGEQDFRLSEAAEAAYRRVFGQGGVAAGAPEAAGRKASNCACMQKCAYLEQLHATKAHLHAL